MKKIIRFEEIFAAKVARLTSDFANSRKGEKFFFLVMLIGPLTFLPTVYQALFGENIEALRTATWPLMIVINGVSYVSLANKGHWSLRVVILIWVVMMLIITTAIIIR